MEEREKIMLKKTIICLANSRKEGGHCIAGKEIVNDVANSNWIRPVGHTASGELRSEATVLYTNKWPQWLAKFFMFFRTNKPQPQLLDIIQISLDGKQDHPYQLENYIIAGKQIWLKQGTLTPEKLEKICDSVASLWVNGYNSFNGMNDRIPVALVKQKINTSLLLIKVKELTILVTEESNRIKTRAEFYYNNQRYKLVITDPKMEARYRFKDGCRKSNVYLCVSLGEPFQDFCYKLIAAIIE